MNDHVDPRHAIGANNPPIAEQLALSEQALLAEVQAIADRANQLPKKLVDATADADIAAIGGVVRDSIDLGKRIEKRRVEVKEPWLAGERAVDGFFKPQTDRLSRVASAFERLVRDYREEKRIEAARKAADEARRKQQEEAERRKAAEEAERRGRAQTAALEQERAEKAAVEAQEAASRAAAANAPLPVTQVKAEISAGLTMGTKGEWVHEVADVRKVDLEALRPFIKGEHLEQAIRLAIRQGVREIGGVRIFQREKVDFR